MSVSRFGAATASATADYTVQRNQQTGTAYTLALGDANRMVEIANASSITLTVPDNNVPFPVGTQVDVLQSAAGAILVSGAAGVTVNSRGSTYRTAGQWAVATLIKRDTNVWLLFGALTT